MGKVITKNFFFSCHLMKQTGKKKRKKTSEDHLKNQKILILLSGG